jgi:hypothetical protein
MFERQQTTSFMTTQKGFEPTEDEGMTVTEVNWILFWAEPERYRCRVGRSGRV